ncbi:Nonribosomal peptide synthetase 14 [Escovopsis weberi]|uniref:Nonribosomal peptide synthetase 14 n=1 Tax=Escovopsis weberi TaxID=150374 RepID=A0A0M8N737_ESCWE|nr:Nonribosomal peptide synthetase 14 [Escovopsis weberi]
MLLEVSYEALENAGIRKEDVDGGDCAVFVGSFVKDYEQICLRDPDWSPQYAATGNGIAIMANRISYALNIHGPSMTIDTGCSGSLIAVHLAAQALRTGESSLAIAAGAGMILSPNTIMPMTALNFLSPDGKCFTFDSRANGYGRGEGIGAVIMKRLSDALRDNDTIHAVIRSTSTNQDGKTTGITLPSKEAQVANIRNAYTIANLDFAQTGYVECHGTGTQAGDWRELKAISETIAEGRPADRRVVVGSIKPNIGHLEGAAGIAGLIKGVLTLKHGKIPSQINFEKGNPNIDFDSWGVRVPTSTLDWPLPGIRRVSVNCFGFGGSNAHVIMDEAPGYLTARGLRGNHSSVDVNEDTSSPPENDSHARLFVYSANDKSGVARVMNSHLPVLDKFSVGADFLNDYAYTLGCRRKKPKLGFIFCGQGSQWAQMGKDLMSYHAFSASITGASTYMKSVLGSPFDLLEELFKNAAGSLISSPKIAQPATTALQVAMVDLLSSFGILPENVVGHSSGEIAAAYAAGALSRESAWKVAYYRGLAAASIPIRAPKLRGGMAVVGMSVEKTQEYLDSVGKSARVACINSPRSVTISGLEEAIQWIVNDLKEKRMFCKVLEVKTAYHSSHMKLVEYDYKDSLGILPTNATYENVRMFSSVTGQLAHGGELNAEYWARNLVSPVQYVAAVESLMSLPSDERPDILIEVSPSAALRSPTSDILGSVTSNAPKYLSVLERKQTGPVSLLTMIGELWARSYAVDMEAVAARGLAHVQLRCLSDLPKYPWNHSKRYWYETHLSRANRFRKYPRQDLIGAPTADSVPFEPRWRGFLRISESPWIQDHQVQKTIIYPAAGMVSMVLEGAKQMAAEHSSSHAELLGYELSDLVIEKAILVPNSAHGLEVALNIRSDSSRTTEKGLVGTHEFAIYSKPQEKPWERHATGKLQFRYKLGDWRASFKHHEGDYGVLKEKCTESLIPRQLYETLDAVGLNYGSSFQNLVEVSKSDNASVSKIRIPDTRSKMPEKFEYPHLLHPVTLDAMFHSLLAIEPVPMVPVAIKNIFVSANVKSEAGSVFTGHSTTSMSGIRGAEADLVMKQANGEDSAFVIINGLRLTRLSSPSPGTFGFLANHRNLTTQIVWKEDAQFASPSSIVEQIDVLAHKYPNLSVLQVGANINLTAAILKAVTPNKTDTARLARLTIAVPGDEKFASDVRALVDGTSVAPLVEMVSDASSRGVAYHLVIVGQSSSAANLRSLLQPGGVLLEEMKPERELGLVNDDSHVWEEVSSEALGAQRVQIKAFKNKAPIAEESSLGEVVFLVPSKTESAEVGAFISAIQERSGDNGQPVIRLRDLRETPEVVSGRVVVSLLETSLSETEDYIFNWEEDDFVAFHALQAEAAAVLWVTRGANMTPHNPKGAPIIALARTLMSEDPLKHIVSLDLGHKSKFLDTSVVESFLSVFKASFCTKPGPGPREVEYAEQDGRLYIPRLTTVEPLNRVIEDENFGTIVKRQFDRKEDDVSGLELDASKLQIFEDKEACFVESKPKELPEDEVEIAFLEAPLSFLDVETLLGRTSDTSIGMDVRGTVKRVGSAVSGFAPGDEVMALVADNAIRNTLNAKASLTKRSVPGFVPSMIVSAVYALVHVGRISRSRKVLIHAGASGHGLAAIQVAQNAGVEIFATVLGSDMASQRDILKQRDVPRDHILDAEADGFVMALLALTNGRGVDVVYNPTLAHSDSNMKIIRKGGTIVSFADKSPAPQARPSISGSMTVVTFDLRSLMEQDAEFVAELFDQATQLSGALRPLPESLVERCDVGSIKDLLSHIQRNPFSRYASAVANLRAESRVSVFSSGATRSLDQSIDANGTYLLSGGLGGLGKSITELLVKNGARHIAHISRSGASSEGAKAFIADLQARGIDARAFAADICDSAALEAVIRGTVAKEMPPIRGVFQCAAVIRDAVFDNMTFEDWDTAVKPKTVGSWNLLHAMDATGHKPFYVFLSSSAGVIGNRGQANYASGNCFQDALARHLRLKGERACSLDLGPILGAGMLAKNDSLLDILRASGFYGIRHGDFLKVVEHAITGEVGHPAAAMPAQVILGVGTGGIIRQNQPADPYWSRTALYTYLNLVDMPPADLSASSGTSNMDMKSMLARAADIDAATAIVCTGLASMLAKSMNLHVEEVDVNRPPSNYGVDSLVAVSVRNWVLGNCGVQISVFEILGDFTIVQLSHTIAEKSGCGQ